MESDRFSRIWTRVAKFPEAENLNLSKDRLVQKRNHRTKVKDCNEEKNSLQGVSASDDDQPLHCGEWPPDQPLPAWGLIYKTS